jgi:hypothetical protein
VDVAWGAVLKVIGSGVGAVVSAWTFTVQLTAGAYALSVSKALTVMVMVPSEPNSQVREKVALLPVPPTSPTCWTHASQPGPYHSAPLRFPLASVPPAQNVSDVPIRAVTVGWLGVWRLNDGATLC